MYTGIAKFLYLMSQVLKDPDVARLTNSLDQQYGSSSPLHPFPFQGMPQFHPPPQHVTMAPVSQSSTHFNTQQSYVSVVVVD